MSASSWDPFKDKESNNLTNTASARIKRDLINLYTDPPPGIFVTGDENNLKFVYALVVGPIDTPYECGFFYFVLKCPNDYPIQPPRVRFMTTDGGKIRFNPNLYKSGKVCVSILGTWSGPAWSPAQQLASLLVTIQSLLTENPFFNEPGIKEKCPGDSKHYNGIITFETLRVAVCGMLENNCSLNIPGRLKDIMNKMFLQFYPNYMQVIEHNIHLNGKTVKNPLTEEEVLLNYSAVRERLEKLYDKLTNAGVVPPTVEQKTENTETEGASMAEEKQGTC